MGQIHNANRGKDLPHSGQVSVGAVSRSTPATIGSPVTE